jgi:hypothetical protein
VVRKLCLVIMVFTSATRNLNTYVSLDQCVYFDVSTLPHVRPRLHCQHVEATCPKAEGCSVQHVAKTLQHVESMLMNCIFQKLCMYGKLLSTCYCRSAFTLATCCRGRAHHVNILPKSRDMLYSGNMSKDTFNM